MSLYSPKEVAANYINIGKAKVAQSIGKLLILGILAGMFIALAGVGASTASSTASGSVARLLSALVFPTGLVMVLLAGSELFTGNNLMIIPLLEKEISFAAMLRNWLFVYIGNLIGSLLVVLIAVYGHQFALFDGGLALTTIKVAANKVNYGFDQAFILAIGCNFLVCIAVWSSLAAQSVSGKVIGAFLPIMLFVLAGFEHSVANMYFIPAGIMALTDPAYAAVASGAGINIANLTWGGFLVRNLLPVTLGNIVGGSFLVGLPYWYVYLRPDKSKARHSAG